MQVKREELLKLLETLTPGLAQREIVEQSNTFVFTKERIFTYNDDIACSCPSPLKDVEGAVPASDLVAILQKLKDKEIDISQDDSVLILTGKRCKSGITMNTEILLPVKYQKKGEWKPLPKNFKEAVDTVKNCASSDASKFAFTCIHIMPKHIEACDNKRAARYDIKTNFEKEVLIRASSLQHVISTDVTEFLEKGNWIHFQNSAGFQISCLRFIGEAYQDLEKVLNRKGVEVVLPITSIGAITCAEVFSSKNEENKLVIHLKGAELQISSQGNSGWFWEKKKVKYTGPDISFTITPKLLIDLLEHDNHCEIHENKMLKITDKNYTYVVVLGMPPE